jgi:hypothetical protein
MRIKSRLNALWATVAVLTLACGSSAVVAVHAEDSANGAKCRVAELQKQLEEQKKLLEEQKKLLDEFRKKLEEMSKKK